MKIKIKEISTYEELLKLEDEIFEHVCFLDTMIYREIMQVTYGNEVHLLISDLAFNFIVAEIPLEKINEDKALQDHLKSRYADNDRWKDFIHS